MRPARTAGAAQPRSTSAASSDRSPRQARFASRLELDTAIRRAIGRSPRRDRSSESGLHPPSESWALPRVSQQASEDASRVTDFIYFRAWIGFGELGGNIAARNVEDARYAELWVGSADVRGVETQELRSSLFKCAECLPHRPARD